MSHLDDEQVSAALDGEATVGEQAHLGECPICRARIDEFRRVSRVLAAARPTAPSASRDEAVATALHPRRRPSSVLRPVAAAIVILVVGGSVVASVALNGGGGGSEAKTTSAAPAAAPAAASPTAHAQSQPPALGSFESGGGVASALRQNRVALGSPSLLPATPVPCAAQAAAAAGLQSTAVAVIIAPLTYRGRSAVVHAYAGGVAVVETGTGAHCGTLAVINY